MPGDKRGILWSGMFEDGNLNHGSEKYDYSIPPY